jgi:hypothetical protein
MPAFATVSSAEDPEKLLDQVVNEMQEDLIKMRQAAAQVGTAHASMSYALLPSLCPASLVASCVMPPLPGCSPYRQLWLYALCRSWHPRSSWRPSTSRHSSQQ